MFQVTIRSLTIAVFHSSAICIILRNNNKNQLFFQEIRNCKSAEITEYWLSASEHKLSRNIWADSNKNFSSWQYFQTTNNFLLSGSLNCSKRLVFYRLKASVDDDEVQYDCLSENKVRCSHRQKDKDKSLIVWAWGPKLKVGELNKASKFKNQQLKRRKNNIPRNNFSLKHHSLNHWKSLNSELHYQQTGLIIRMNQMKKMKNSI